MGAALLPQSWPRKKKGNESKIKRPHMGRGNCFRPPNGRYLCSYTLGNKGVIPGSTFITHRKDNDGPTSGNGLDPTMPRTLWPKGIDLLSRRAPALFHLLNSPRQPACGRLAWWQVGGVPSEQESWVGNKPRSLPREDITTCSGASIRVPCFHTSE